jgi:hypothetical protein
MSTAGAATLAVIRDTPRADGEKVTKADTGTGGSDQLAGAIDILAKLVPTGVIASYSGVLTIMLGLIPEATAKEPTPNQQIGWRIGIYVVFVAIAAIYAAWAYSKRKVVRTANRKAPWELFASVFAFVAWGLVTPGSWLIDLFDDKIPRTILPLLIGAFSVALLSRFALATKATAKQ